MLADVSVQYCNGGDLADYLQGMSVCLCGCLSAALFVYASL